MWTREADDADHKDEAKALYGVHLKLSSELEKDLTQNLAILWATIMGQCTTALQEEVHCMWLHKDNGYQSKGGDLTGTTRPSDTNSNIFGSATTIRISHLNTSAVRRETMKMLRITE